MRKMDVTEMMAVNAGGKCKYCKVNKAWYELWWHQGWCGMLYNWSTTGRQRRYY